MVVKELYCPFCGQKMEADIHAPEDGAKWKTPPGPPPSTTESLRKLDHWICYSDGVCKCKYTGDMVLIDRDDLKEWFDIE